MTLGEQILHIVHAKPGVRVPEIVLHLETSESSVRRALKALKAEGQAEFRGASKTGGCYAISSDRDADS